MRGTPCLYLVVVATAALFAVSTNSVCGQKPIGEPLSGNFFVRVWNEGQSELRLYAQDPKAVNTVAPTKVSPYVAVPVHEDTPTRLQLKDEDGSVVWSHEFPLFPSLGRSYSVFAAQRSDASDWVVSFLQDDREQAVSDGIDKARFRVFNAFEADFAVDVRGVTSNCWRCLKPLLCTVRYGEVTGEATCDPSASRLAPPMAEPGYFVTDVRHEYDVDVVAHGSTPGEPNTGNYTVLAFKRFFFKEHGVYTVVVRNATATPLSGSAPLTVVTDVEGNNVYIALYVTLAVLAALAIAYRVCSRIYTKWFDPSEGDDDLSPNRDFIVAGQSVSLKPRLSGRIKAIDTMRGLSLCIMIFVNYGGGGYWFLDHSRWTGLTIADLVFPWFMWLMGTSMALSIAGQQRRGASRSSISIKIIVRSIKLYCIGMFLQASSDLYNWRVPGVLQYFGVAAFINAMVALWVPTFSEKSKSGADESLLYESVGPDGGSAHLTTRSVNRSASSFISAAMADILPYSLHYAIMACLLVIYLCLQYFLDVPGCGRGYTGPGGLADYGKHAGCTGGAHRYIDVKIWGEHHMYHNDINGDTPVSAATCADTYDCQVYDPEGTLGYLTSTVMTFFGLQAGRVIVHFKSRSHWSMLKRWVVWGIALALIGGFLCEFKKHDGFMPLSKNLWSPSFISVMAGTGFLLLSLCYILVDLWHMWSGAPFRFVGMNSIIVYAGSEILQPYFPFTFNDHSPGDNFTGGYFMTHEGAMASNTIGVLLWCTISYLFYRNNFFYNL